MRWEPGGIHPRRRETRARSDRREQVAPTLQLKSIEKRGLLSTQLALEREVSAGLGRNKRQAEALILSFHTRVCRWNSAKHSVRFPRFPHTPLGKITWEPESRFAR